MNPKDIDIDKWMNYKGEKFLEEIGVKKDSFILDFGCGHGNYTIPASFIVGKNGRIVSIDKNIEKLYELKNKIDEKKLDNIELLKAKDSINLPLLDESFDVVLLYDILHLLENRKVFLSDVKRILKTSGILSVYPKHHDTDMNMSLDDIKDEIVSVGFILNDKKLSLLVHDDQIEEGYVFNFKKKR